MILTQEIDKEHTGQVKIKPLGPLISKAHAHPFSQAKIATSHLPGKVAKRESSHVDRSFNFYALK